MTEADLAALTAWLHQTQDTEIEPERLRDAAAAAGKFSAMAGRSARALPFGAEPSGFLTAIAEAAVAGGDDDR